MCTSWWSANQISNCKFSAFFGVLFALWPLKYPRPKSQQAPRVSTELEMVIKLLYSFIPLQKILQKGIDRPVENPQKCAKNIKMTSNAPNKFFRRMRKRNALGGGAFQRHGFLLKVHAEYTRKSQLIYARSRRCHICSWIFNHDFLRITFEFSVSKTTLFISSGVLRL